MNMHAIAKPSFGGLPDLMTRRELATYFSISLRTSYNWIEQKILPEPSLYVGNRPRWSRQQIEAAILSAKVGSNED